MTTPAQPSGEHLISDRPGHTLIELMVALALVALLAALAAPAFLAPRTATDGAAAEVVARARRLTIQRGSPTHLDVRADGAWRLAPHDDRGDAVLSGRLPAPQPRVALDLTATGLCISSADAAWDPVLCAPAAPAAR